MNKEKIVQEIDLAILANSETELVEFKDARGGFPAAQTKKTLSSFGNKEGGGIIVFGIAENKDTRKITVVGVDDIAVLQEGMSALSSNEMNFVLRLEYHILSLLEVKVLAVYVPECKNQFKPYHIKQLGLPNGAYVRDGNTDRKMTEDEMKSYVRNAQGDDFDGTCAKNTGPEELSAEKIEKFLQKSAKKAGRDFDSNGTNENVLCNIGVICDCDGQLKPTIAGYLIFANGNPQKKLEFERYVIRCVRYKGSGVHTDILDKADILGTLDEQIDAMQSFVLRNIRKSAEIVGTKRVEKYEYPEKAIREILANAVIHRDYRITETYTQVNIFEDRIEVFNPGNLPPGVTVENIKTAQVSRNKIIAARLNGMDYLEEYGRGIDIVFTEMNKWGLLSPLFKNTSNSFRVILPGEKLSQLNERQLKIWEHLAENGRITRRGAEILSVETAQQTISGDLRKMKDMGLIKQIGESKDTFYESSF